MARPKFRKETTEQILSVLQNSQYGMPIAGVTLSTGLNKRTVMRYLNDLESKGQVFYFWIGRAKVYRLRRVQSLNGSKV